MRPIERQVADWLVALGPLVAARMTPDEAKTRLSAYVPLLVQTREGRDFSEQTRQFVARKCKFFPSYAELCDHLDAFPHPVQTQAAIAGPDGDQLTPDEAGWVAFYLKRRAEIWAQDGAFRRGSRDAEMANLDSLVRSMSLRAWYRATGTQPETHRAEPTQAELEAVARAVRTFKRVIAGGEA